MVAARRELVVILAVEREAGRVAGDAKAVAAATAVALAAMAAWTATRPCGSRRRQCGD